MLIPDELVAALAQQTAARQQAEERAERRRHGYENWEKIQVRFEL